MVNVFRKIKEKVPKYPYIGEDEEGNLIYFTQSRSGVSLKGIYKGSYRSDWLENLFTPTDTPVTLVNEV